MFKARHLKEANLLSDAWSCDERITIKMLSAHIRTIPDMKALEQYMPKNRRSNQDSQRNGPQLHSQSPVANSSFHVIGNPNDIQLRDSEATHVLPFVF